VAVAIVVELYLTLGADRFGLKQMPSPVPHAAGYSNTKELGRMLYTEYVYAFEIAAAVLLVAIIAAIALTMRKRPETKRQDPAKQSAVRRQDRVRLVKMKAESND